MIEHSHNPPGAESFRSKEGKEQISAPAILNTEQDLVDFWSVFRRNNGMAVGDEKMEKRMALMQARQTLAQAESQAGINYFFGAKNGDKMVATGKLEIRHNIDGEKHGYLSFLTVDEEFRGRGVAKQLTDVRSDFAREAGCSYVDTDVFAENPVALVTKFNDGYFLTAIDLSDTAKKFSLAKRIDGKEEKFDKKKGQMGEMQEVNLSDLEAVKNY